MLGLMMDFPLTLTHFLKRAGNLFANKEIVTRLGDGAMHRYTYADYVRRVNRLAWVLKQLGVDQGDRVGVLAWNTYQHLELYYALPCFGAVLHTLNLRLPQDQLLYIINHAEDKVIFVDASLVPTLEAMKDQIPVTKRFVIMNPPSGGCSTSLAPTEDYETLLAASPETPFSWPNLDERSACGMCYTSGTTGNPKGVLYSHRALFIHTLSFCLKDVMGLSESDTIFPITPMFHANAWGIPHAAIMLGAKLVLPGPQPLPIDNLRLLESEKVTFSCAVPTVWMMLDSIMQREPRDLSSLRMIACGGSAVPLEMMRTYQEKYGVKILQLWGMTETSPLGTVAHIRGDMQHLTDDEKYRIRTKQGSPAPGIEIRAIQESGEEAPWDGQTMGELQVRGPWVVKSYYNDDRNAGCFVDGWFKTSDVVTIDAHGYIQIMDRTKDVIKSGGEWISSVELENTIMAHPEVLEAAVIAIPDVKWQERPMALVALHERSRGKVSKQDILDFLAARTAKWWLPEEVLFVDSIPKTSVGKFNKRVMREIYTAKTGAPSA